MPVTYGNEAFDGSDGLNATAGAYAVQFSAAPAKTRTIGKISPLNHEALVPEQLEIGCKRVPANRLRRISASDVFAIDTPTRDSR